MIDFSGSELALLDGARYGSHLRLLIKDGAGTWQDMTSFAGEDWIDAVEWGDEIDQYAARGSATFRSSIGAQKLAPLLASSALNDPGGGYDPLLNVGREVRIDVSITAPGAAPGTWRRVFEGYIDTTEIRERRIHITFRSRVGRLLDADTDQDAIYPTSGSSATVETVMQQLIDETVGAGVFTLVTPVATGRTFYAAWVQQGKLFDRLRAMALDIGGWDLRYRWNSSAARFDLMLVEPDRAITTPQHTFGADQYLDVQDLSLTIESVRNVVRVEWGAGNFFATEDTASIAKYGRRFQAFAQQAPNLRGTLADASDFAAAVLSDLAEPGAVQQIEHLFWPCVEVGDFYRWLANGTHYDSDRDWAVVGYRHVYSAAQRRTEIRVRGKPSGALKSWLRLPSSAEPPLGQIWYNQYQGENLLLVPGFDAGASKVYTESFSVSKAYIEPVLDTFGRTVSGSIQVNSDDVTDRFRAAVWFTDGADALIGSKYLGDFMAQATAGGGSFGRVHNVPVPPTAVKIHVSVEPVGAVNGTTVTISRPHLNVGPIAGTYTPSLALQSGVELSNFRETSGAPAGDKRYTWIRGQDVTTVRVWERTSLPWPAVTDAGDADLAVGTDQYDVTIPGAGSVYLQFATIDSAGNLYLQQRVEIVAPSSATDTPSFDGAIRTTLVTGPPAAVDLQVFVDGNSVSFPLDVEIRLESRTGTLIASHTFSAAGSIDKVDYAALGARAFDEESWWLKMEAADGTIIWAERSSPYIDLSRQIYDEITSVFIGDDQITAPKIAANSVQAIHIEAGSIDTAHLAAGAVTAAKIDVTELSAISATLGDVIAGSIALRFGVGDLSFQNNAGSESYGAIDTIFFESSPIFQYGISIVGGASSLSVNARIEVYSGASNNTGKIEISADLGVVIDGPKLDGVDGEWGANDSGGTGKRAWVADNV